MRSLMRLAGPLAMLWSVPAGALRPAAPRPAGQAVGRLQGPVRQRPAGDDGPQQPHPHAGPEDCPQAQVNNPAHARTDSHYSPNQLQVSAKATGVTQAEHLGRGQEALHGRRDRPRRRHRSSSWCCDRRFPHAVAEDHAGEPSSVLISGFVDQPEEVERIIRIAEEYYPKVINNMKVGGCQQVLLHVKMMEVSRTKLRRLGFDFSKVTGASTVSSGAAGLLNTIVTTPGSDHLHQRVQQRPQHRRVRQFRVRRRQRQQRLLRRARRLAGRRSDENLGRADADGDQRAIRPRSTRAGKFHIIPNGRMAGPPIDQSQYGTQIWTSCRSCWETGKSTWTSAPQVSEHRPQPTPAIPAAQSRIATAKTPCELEAGQTLAIAGLVQTVSRPRTGACPGSARCRTWERRSARQRETERDRVADHGHAGVGRGDGRQRSAALWPRHANHQPQRLGVVHEGSSRSAQLLPQRRQRRVRPRRRRSRRPAPGRHDARPAGRADSSPAAGRRFRQRRRSGA